MTRDRTWKVGKVSRFRLDGHTGTAFHKSTAALATTNWYFNWDLRMVPDEYVDYSEELNAIRTNVAMGDMSPLTKCVVSGRDAARAVDFLVTRDTRKLEVDLYAEGRRTGWASSIVWSPTVRRLIAFAFVEREVANVGGVVQVDWTVKGGVSGRVPATLVSLPFIGIRRSS